MTFVPAVREQRFVLERTAEIAELAAFDRFSDATPDVVEAVLEGAGQLAQGDWEPIARIGDTVGPRLSEQGVVMPDGYAGAYHAYVEGGWGGLAAPVDYGGQGLPFVLASAVLETLGAANMGLALAPTLTLGAIEAIAHHGTAGQRQTYLPHLITGAWTGTMNLTEPQAGSDVGALRTRAEPTGDGGWRIKGTKIFISFGDHDMAANIVHLVLARTPGAPEGTRGISLFLVPKFRLDGDGSPSVANDVRVVSIEHKLGLHASPTCVLSFGDEDDCLGELLGAEHGGMRAMFTMMNNARLNVGLQGVQVAEAATQRAVAYASGRIQSARAGDGDRSSVPIIEHPDVRRMLLRMRAQTQAARALVYYAASMVDRAALGDEAARERLELLTPLAKAHATDLGNEVASLGVQVHGGMGYIEETGAAQHFRDARITPIYEGTNGIQAADLVQRKLGLAGGRPLASLISEIRSDSRDADVRSLLDACETVAAHLDGSRIDERLAASYPFLTMLSTVVCGWLMERQVRPPATDDAFGRMKVAASRFYRSQVLPEAMGLRSAAMAPASELLSITSQDLAA